MRGILREPLFHFFLIGLALFLMYGWLQGGLLSSPNEIVVPYAIGSVAMFWVVERVGAFS